MRVRVLFFAAAREMAGRTEVDVEVAEGATVDSLFTRLAADHEGLADVLRACRAAVDEEFTLRATALADGQTVAILPPVSGG
jgi:molybdopterin converting factor subunit 1